MDSAFTSCDLCFQAISDIVVMLNKSRCRVEISVSALTEERILQKWWRLGQLMMFRLWFSVNWTMDWSHGSVGGALSLNGGSSGLARQPRWADLSAARRLRDLASSISFFPFMFVYFRYWPNCGRLRVIMFLKRDIFLGCPLLYFFFTIAAVNKLNKLVWFQFKVCPGLFRTHHDGNFTHAEVIVRNSCSLIFRLGFQNVKMSNLHKNT